MKKAFVIILVFMGLQSAKAQIYTNFPDSVKNGVILPCIEIDGKIVPHIFIREIIILPPRTFKNKREKERYTRLVRHVKKVYPYSQVIKHMLVDISNKLDSMPNERTRNAYVKKKEKELKKEFEGQLRSLTFTQGRILIKLINRETGETTYEIVKELKGSLSAFFWQSVAVVFNSSLKYEYDAKGDDLLIEEIVIKIENGQL
jgi:chaperonin GroEL (HSP60 family)